MPSHASPRDASGRTFSEYVTERVADAVYRSGHSVRHMAELSGINHMTLLRSLHGQRVLNVDDIAALAHALGITPADPMDAAGFEPI